MADSRVPELALAQDPSIAVRLTQFVSTVVGWILGPMLVRILWILAVRIAIGIAVTIPLREGKPLWAEIVIVVVAVALQYVLGYLDQRAVFLPGVRRLILGREAFEDLPFIPYRQFKFMVRSLGGIRFTFDAKGSALIAAVGEANEQLLEDSLREQYTRMYAPDGWPEAWKKIGDAPIDGMTFRDAMRSGLWGTIAGTSRYVSDILNVLIAIYYGVAVWLLVDAIARRDALLLVQVTVVSGLLVAGFSFIMTTVGLRSIRILDPDAAADVVLPSEAFLVTDSYLQAMEKAKTAFQATDAYRLLKENVGRTFLPGVEIHPGYVRAIRGLVVKQTLILAVESSLMVLVLLLVQWLAGLVISEWSFDQLGEWTVTMVLGCLAIPLVLTAAAWLGFWVFTQFSRFLAVVITAAAAAVIPILIGYLFGAATPQETLVSSIVSASIGALSAGLVELTKKQPGASTARQLPPKPVP